MRALVTGAAGFIGSSLVDKLLEQNHEVVGIDCFTPYYPRGVKDANLKLASKNKNFTFREIDLAVDQLSGILEGVTDVFHQAGQPGVRASWGIEFHDYVQWNIWGTQRLLEESRKSEILKSFVSASSSSVYGKAEKFPTLESDLPQPISPYGVTKLAAENLCTLYGTQFGLPTVSLRYFTVYGPRQRPDMAISRIIHSALTGSQFVLFGDGNQQRDFTYVSDVVDANLKASIGMSSSIKPGSVFNVGGNPTSSLLEIIERIESISGEKVKLRFIQNEVGDPEFTAADISYFFGLTGWTPKMAQIAGLEAQFKWTQKCLSDGNEQGE
jgi:UDP-glucuronate 4-epimerase